MHSARQDYQAFVVFDQPVFFKLREHTGLDQFIRAGGAELAPADPQSGVNIA